MLPTFAHIFSHIAELVILIQIRRKEEKAEIEIHQLIVEDKMKKVFNIV